jgi:hypothetical protein
MLKKANVARRSLAPEPAGPLELPFHGRSSNSSYAGRALRLQLGRGATVALCIAVQLLAVLVVYAAHVSLQAPRLRQNEGAAAELHSRLSLLEQQQQVPASKEVLLDSWGMEASGAPAALRMGGGITSDRRGVPSSSHSSGQVNLPGQQGGVSAKCTVRLGEADEHLLRVEIRKLAESLAEERGWPVDAPDATDPAELGSKVCHIPAVGGWVCGWVGWVGGSREGAGDPLSDGPMRSPVGRAYEIPCRAGP